MRNMKKGFTIIEMVIVIAIIGILAAVLIPTYGNVVSNANESAALQTARSTMTNWLASSTTSAGVPTSGSDGNGNQFYAAYFEYSNDSGTTYQFRYTSGGVERTDENPSMYVNFSQKDQKIDNLPDSALPKYIAEAYLTTAALDTSFDATTYKVSLYKQTVGSGDKVSTNYYIKYPATGAYTCGGADVYAAVSENQEVYIGGNKYLIGGTDEALAWVTTTNTGSSDTSGTTYTLTKAATAITSPEGVTLDNKLSVEAANNKGTVTLALDSNPSNQEDYDIYDGEGNPLGTITITSDKSSGTLSLDLTKDTVVGGYKKQ